MAQYCDSKVLESDWFNWLMSSSTPELERYRELGILYTKLPILKGDPELAAKRIPDSLGKQKSHCLAITDPVYFNSSSGTISKMTRYKNGKPVTVKPPVPGVVDVDVAAKLANSGWFLERPTAITWDSIVIAVNSICSGISTRFNLPDDAKSDLASEAMVQVITKIKLYKLVYTPGRAPVFNLVTTTIYRIMFSILNKNTKNKQNMTNAAQMMQALSSNNRNKSGKRIITKRRFGGLVAQVQ